MLYKLRDMTTMKLHEVEADFELDAISKLSEKLNISIRDIEVIRNTVRLNLNTISNK